MTYEQALEILKTPKFGDPRHIEAVARVEVEPELKGLRDKLVGYENQENCPICGCFDVVVTPEMLSKVDDPEKLRDLRFSLLGEDDDDD